MWIWIATFLVGFFVCPASLWISSIKYGDHWRVTIACSTVSAIVVGTFIYLAGR